MPKKLITSNAIFSSAKIKKIKVNNTIIEYTTVNGNYCASRVISYVIYHLTVVNNNLKTLSYSYNRCLFLLCFTNRWVPCSQ